MSSLKQITRKFAAKKIKGRKKILNNFGVKP